MTIINEVHNVQEWDKQTRAVAAHLEKHGAIYKRECTHGGIPGYGVIEHPGARIFGLREAGCRYERRRAQRGGC
jgi:hypothetical protein